MFVCVCNAIRESEFRRAARQADGDAEAIYATLGWEPQCRTCLEEADLILEEERQMDRTPRLVA